MTWIDWVVLVATVLIVVATGMTFFFKGYIRSVKDFLLAGRTQKWYIIGPDCQATQSDVADYLGCAGMSYQHGGLGMAVYTFYLQSSWLLGSATIIPQMYRAGVYTPAEFLELRFNYPARFWGGFLIWLQRVYVMGAILSLMAIVMEIAVGTKFLTGMIIIGLLCLGYTVMGGLSAAMVTGTAQMSLMTLTSWVMFLIGLHKVGGWSAMLEKTAAGAVKHAISGDVIQSSFYSFGHIPSAPWMPVGLAFIGMFFAIGSYAVIQAEQISRPLGARTEMDARLGYLAAGPIALIHQFSIVWVGTLGVILYGYMAPQFNPAVGGKPDAVYVQVMKDLAPPGILGLLLAGIFAATLSTVPSNAQSCAGILTRDIYAKIIRREASEEHYLLVARLLTTVNFILGLLFIPIIQRGGGYIVVWVKLTGALISPLFAVMVWSTISRFFSRWSAFLGMMGGAIFGLWLTGLFPWFAMPKDFPTPFGYKILTHFTTVPLWNFLFTTALMVVISLIENAVKGPIPEKEIEGYVLGTFPPQVKPYLHRRVGVVSEKGVVEEAGDPIYGTEGLPWYKQPRTWTIVILAYLALWVIIWW
ncbi:MAG: hypothetical protein HY347_07745 [candidate division NC10 bacterium]|nr:hypothetical protein [candidate division NC10 bacterium]